MPIITRITTQQRNKERYNIYIDEGKGEQYAFSVDEGVLIQFQLKKGMELDSLLVTEIQYEDDIRKAYNRAVQYLARRMRSEFEVISYLEEKEVETPVIREVIRKLYQYQFLDDKQYARSYVRTVMNTSDKGPVLIKRELLEKGIQESIIEAVLPEYPYEKQIETAQKICEKLVNNNRKDSDLVLKQKLEAKLVRKGYSFDIISEITGRLELDRSDEINEALHYQGERFKRKYRHLTGYEYKQKMTMALYRKGFSLDQIGEYLRESSEIE